MKNAHLSVCYAMQAASQKAGSHMLMMKGYVDSASMELVYFGMRAQHIWDVVFWGPPHRLT